MFTSDESLYILVSILLGKLPFQHLGLHIRLSKPPVDGQNWILGERLAPDGSYNPSYYTFSHLLKVESLSVSLPSLRSSLPLASPRPLSCFSAFSF